VGLGMSIVPTGVVKKEVRRGLIKAIRISKEKMLLRYSMIYRKDKYISHIIKAFINMALEDSRPDPLYGKPY
jgi:DNA-binding transcriptional LysR family regulator